MTVSLAEQQLIAHRYRLVAELGRGGMGEVWRARDERLDRDVAVKILHPWVAEDPELRDRLEREALALARLSHPGIVRLYDAQHDGERSFIVMELVEGSSIAALLRDDRRLSWKDAQQLLRPVAEALAYAHDRGVVHRDLSPANILVDHECSRVVVTDFGLARLARSGSRSTTGVLAGTPEYWAPEQARGDDTAAPADVYALGCILFRALTGRLPFEGEDRLATGLRRAHEDAPGVAALVPDVPEAACSLVGAMLRRDPQARPTAAQVAHALGAESVQDHVRGRVAEPETLVGSSEPPTRVVAVPATIGRVRRPFRARRKRRGLFAAGVLAGIAVVGSGGVLALATAGGPGIETPSVVGDSLGQARTAVSAAANAAGVDAPAIHVASSGYSDLEPSGAVLAQDPAAGHHLDSSGALWVRLSLGSPSIDVPPLEGLPTSDALDTLAQAGLSASKRYGPSVSVPAWHVIETSPAAGERVRRPASVQVLVSTGPPKVAVPDLVGDDQQDALDRLDQAGFGATVETRPSATADPGTVLEVTPASGSKLALGSAVTVIVAREPQWKTLSAVDSSDARDTGPIAVPGGARVVLVVDNTSFLNLLDGAAIARWTGDASGEVEVAADRNDNVLVEPTAAGRSISFHVEPSAGDVHWYLRVEAVG